MVVEMQGNQQKYDENDEKHGIITSVWLLTVVMYCSSNVPWGQNILLTWRLLPIKRLVKCRADIQGNTSPAFKGQFFLEVSRDFGSCIKWFLPWIHRYPRDMFFFWMKNFKTADEETINQWKRQRPTLDTVFHGWKCKVVLKTRWARHKKRLPGMLNEVSITFFNVWRDFNGFYAHDTWKKHQ